MNNLFQQLRAFHEQLDPQRRRVLYVAVALALAAVIGVGFWASEPTLVEVAHPASADELSDVTTALAQAGITYEVDTMTRAVSVPSLSRADALRAITTEPIDAGSGNPFPTPDQERYVQTVARQKALERTINAYEGVSSSKVHLNLPESSPFFKDDKVATASVMVRADPGMVLSPKLGRTIARTVSGANEGMSLYDVSVSDASGRELWPGDMDNEEGGGVAIQSARRESELSRGLLTSLSAILGSAEDLTVSVSVELETSTRQETVQALDPNTGVATQEKITSEKSTGRAAGGVPGSDTNLPEVSTAGGSPGPGGKSSDTTTTTYDYSKTTTTTSVPPGGVRRLSASVMINSAAIARVLGTPEGQVMDDKAAAALKADLEEATRAALGFNATRGDQVVVKFVKFAEVVPEEAPAPPLLAQAEPYLPLAAAAVAFAMVFFGVIRPLMRMVRAAPVSPAGSAGAPMVLGPDGKMMPAANSPMPEEADGETSVDLMERLRNYIENYQAVTPGDLSDLVRRETVHSAEVVRRWIRG